MVSRATCAPAWGFPTRNSRAKWSGNRHCERSEAIHSYKKSLDCFVASLLAMTSVKGIEHEAFVEIRHHYLWRHRLHRPARRRIFCGALLRQGRSEMGDGRTQPGKTRFRARW